MSVNINDFIPNYLAGVIEVVPLLNILIEKGDLHKILDFSARVLTVHNGTQVSDNWTAESLLTSTCAHKKICACFYPNWPTRVAGISVQGYDQTLSFIRQLNSDNNYTRILRIANTFVNRTNANRGRRQSLHATSSKCLGSTPAEFVKCYPSNALTFDANIGSGGTPDNEFILIPLDGQILNTNSAPFAPNAPSQYSFYNGTTWTSNGSDSNINSFIIYTTAPGSLISQVNPGDTFLVTKTSDESYVQLFVVSTHSFGGSTEGIVGIYESGTGSVTGLVQLWKKTP